MKDRIIWSFFVVFYSSFTTGINYFIQFIVEAWKVGIQVMGRTRDFIFNFQGIYFHFKGYENPDILGTSSSERWEE
jgi:hypothetical protein